MSADYEKLFGAFFHEAADAAGKIALKYFRQDIAVDEKADKSPVTQADREIEQKLREMIGNAFPAHGVIGEEFGEQKPDAEFVWVLDPIDGTKSFITGLPFFGAIIGLMHNNKPVMGLVDQPYTKERWFGITDVKATHNGKPIKVATPRKLAAARFYTGSPSMFEGASSKNHAELCRAAKLTKYGCDCYAYGLVAMGCADLVLEQDMKIYDIAGIIPIITAACGFVGDWNLNPIVPGFNNTVVAASTKELAGAAVAIMKKSA